ncbi:MAG: hypothetical protein ABIJ97_05590 [Bacteroidota bacterium]
MLIIFGTRYVKTPVRNGMVVKEYCQKCDHESQMTEQTIQNFGTLFFIPLFQNGDKEFVLTCSECNTSYKLNQRLHENKAEESKVIRMYPNNTNISYTDGLVLCLKCKKPFNKIYTDCPVCHFDSAGRAECAFCGSEIDQFDFIRNRNRCPHCNSEKLNQNIPDNEQIKEKKQISINKVAINEKTKNPVSNIIFLLAGLLFIVLTLFLTNGYEYYSYYHHFFMAVGVIMFITGLIKLLKKH